MQRFLRWVRNPWFIAAVAAVPLYAIVGYLVIPYLIERFVPSIASEKLQRQVTLGQARLDPFRLSLELRDLALKEQNGEPMLSVGRLFADLELASAIKRAVILDRLEIEKPSVHLVIDTDGRLNLSKIADAFPPSTEPPPTEPTPPPAIQLRHSALIDGSAEFIDRSRGEPIAQHVDAINLALEEISTLPDTQGPLHIQAKFGDASTLDWKGTVSLNPIFSEGDVRLDGFKLATPWDFIKSRFNLEPPTGQLDVAAHYRVRKDPEHLDAVVEGVSVALGGLSLLAPAAKEPMLALDSIRLTGASFDLAARKLHVPSFTIENGKVRTLIDETGRVSWLDIVKPTAPATPAPTSAAAATTPEVAAQNPPAAATPPPAPPQAPPENTTAVPAATSATTAVPAPPASESAPWHIDLDAFKLAGIAIQVIDGSRKTPLELGIDRFGFGFRAGSDIGSGEPKVSVDDFATDVGGIALQQFGRKEPLARIESIRLGGGHVDLEKREASLQQVLINGGTFAVSKEPDGIVRPLDAFAGRTDGAPAPTPAAQASTAAIPARPGKSEGAATATTPPSTKQKSRRPTGKAPATAAAQPAVAASDSASPAWHLTLKEAGLQGFRVSIADRSLSPALAYDLSDITLGAKNLVNDGKTPVPFTAALRIDQGGTVTVAGTASQTGARADADVRVERFDLKGLQPIIGQFAALKIEGGDVSTKMNVAFVRGDAAPSLKARGEVHSNDLLLRESASGKRFVSWKTLTVSGIDFGLEPNKLAIEEIRLGQPGANVEIFQDRTTNIAAIFNAKPAAKDSGPTPQLTPTSVTPAASSPAPKKTSARAAAPLPAGKAPAETRGPADKPVAAARTTPAKPFPFGVERVRVDKAIVDFADASLVFPFKTRIQDFHGTVSGISSSPASRTQLEFEGRIDDYGEADLNGTLNLMQFKTYSTVALVFRNVDMSSLSPYSGTFAGRRIKSGKLNVDLDYKIENNRLSSQNKIVLDQLTLGEQVESPKAKSLPLDLAVALLTDNEGKISASIPIEGDVNDPKFAIGPVVWDAISALILRVVSAPFTALAGLFSDGGDQANEIFFGGGRDYLPPGEREKIKNLAAALTKRPKVAIEIRAGFDPKLDGETLKAKVVRVAVVEKLGAKLAPGEDPGPVAFETAKAQRALEDLAAEQPGETALQQAIREYREKTGKEPSRIGGLSSLVGKATQDTEFYRILFDQLAAAQGLPATELPELAKRRAAVVLKEITARAGFDRNRVKLGPDESRDTVDGRVPSRLELIVGEAP